jgi:DnaA family protein
MKQLLLDFTQSPAPTFANYVSGRNAEAVAALRAAASGSCPERVIYLWGDSGAGKSHLLEALRESARAPIRIIDPIDSIDEDTQAELFNAFVDRSFNLLVVAAQAAPAHIALRRDLATRLATGLTFRIVALSDEEKLDALAAHATTRGFALAEDVGRYLIRHTRRDMNTLMGALDSIDRFSLETGRPVTVPLLKAALQSQPSA